jgi:transcriptional regulator with XRE-family HTH domain
MWKSIISKNIILLMEHHNIKNESKLAQLANIPQSTINKIISGNTPDPRISTILPIAKYFNVTLDTLLNENPIFASELQDIEAYNAPNQLIPLVTYNELLEIHSHLDSLTPGTWPHWLPIPRQTQKTACYYAVLLTNTLDEPFEQASILILSNDNGLPNNRYCLLQHIKSNTTYLKKIKLNDGKKWLFALQKNLPPSEFKETEWTPLGVIEASLNDMSDNSFIQIGEQG